MKSAVTAVKVSIPAPLAAGIAWNPSTTGHSRYQTRPKTARVPKWRSIADRDRFELATRAGAADQVQGARTDDQHDEELTEECKRHRDHLGQG